MDGFSIVSEKIELSVSMLCEFTHRVNEIILFPRELFYDTR